MNAKLTSSALTLHNLALAAGFGGSLFGQAAFNPAVTTISDRKERGEIFHKAWKGYSPVNGASLATVALTWLAGRTLLSGREIDRQTRALVIAKDVLVGLYTAAGLGSMVTGLRFESRQPPIETGSEPSIETPDRDAKTLKATNWLGRINLIAGAGIIAVTAVLNAKAGKSSRWARLSHLLP